ncbi:MAG: hypothetical protein ACSHX9_02940 [Luteolibacter sp.]
MKSYQISIFVGLSGLCLAITSCGDLNQPLEGGFDPLDSGMGSGAMGRTMPTGGSFDLRTTFHDMHVATATAEQRKSAEESASKALKSSAVVKQLKKEKVKYVAVPVKRSSTQKKSGTTMMKVNVDTGVSTGEVFVAKSSGPKDGENFKLGGDSTVYLALTGDKL